MNLFGNWRKKTKSDTGKDEVTFAPDAAAAPSPAAAQSAIGKGRKILVVDDNLVVLKAFELKLKGCGFEVLTAAEGAAAVSTARQSRPDLIVLDINFPADVGSAGLHWDGFNIMQWLRRFHEVATTPVIIITSGDPATLRPKAMEAGAVDFFQKPINFVEFLVAAQRAMNDAGGGPEKAA